MSKKPTERIFRIAVVGLSGDEKTKGSAGVGKSCLCNRFVRPHADHFYKDHISIISQIDFSGRVINNDHFLYWGEVTKSLDDGTQVTCSILELTEFIDDQSFQPLRGHGDKDYKKRCKTSLSSAEKLMYICKDQLGDEQNYDRKIMPDGKFQVDGFLVVFDVSRVQNRPPTKQATFITDLLSGSLGKSKKPCVLVATKCEEPEGTAYDEVKAIKEKKKLTLVETSAFENVNVDFAFLTLVNLIDRTKRRPAEVPFVSGIKKQKEILDKVEEAYMLLLARTVTDYHDIWNRTKKKLQDEETYQTYLRYFGSEIAAKKFRSHTKKLKEAQQQRKKQQCLETLPLALKDMLPDLASIGGRDWKACQEILLAHPKFDTWFIRLPAGESWRTSDYIDNDDQQIALDFLQTNASDCEKCFKAHDNQLKEALKRARMKVDFGKLLHALDEVVLPGRLLEDTLTHLVDEESYRYLTAAERQEIYNAHQLKITEQAKKDFVELLLEKIETFEDFDMDNVNAHMEAIIKSTLEKEPRYKNLDNLNQDRRLLLMKHAAFVDNPCQQTCPSQNRCMDKLIDQLLEQRVPRCTDRELPDRWTEPSSKLNLIVLGKNGLADELANEIRAQSVQEEYTLDNVIYSLELRPIDGDVERPQNHFSTPEFRPQGCICTFSSLEDLGYVADSLRKSQLIMSPDSPESIYATLQPEMPVILLFARDLSVPESDIAQMRLDVNKLAGKLMDCTIVDMPIEETTLWHGKKFHDSQISRSIRAIVDSRRRSGHDRDDELSHDGSQYDPDLRYDNQSLYDTIVQSNDTVQSFLGNQSGNGNGNGNGKDPGPGGPPAGRPRVAAKPREGLTESESQFDSRSPLLSRKAGPIQSPGIGEALGTEQLWSDDDDGDDPILRIGMALMCGDPNLPDLVLGPIISNETCCFDLTLNQTVNVDMFLNSVKRRVSIEITSFHQAKMYMEDVHHGYILVYSTKRRASFETLKFFVKSITPIPIEIVAVSDTEKFSSDYEMQTLIAEGNKLADETKNCSFITASANFGNQSLAYSTFFTEAYEKFAETERVHEEIFGPMLDDDNFDEDRQGIRTPLEPPQSGFGENVYAKPQVVKGVIYPPAQTVVSSPGNRARALSAGETPSLVTLPSSRNPPVYDHLVRPSDIKSQQKLLRQQGKSSEEGLYDQPENFPVSPKRYHHNQKGEAPSPSADPIYAKVQKLPKEKPVPAPRRRNSAQSEGSKDATGEGRANRRSSNLSLRRSSSASARSSGIEDDEGFVDNVLYDRRPPGNGSAHYASTQLFDAHLGDMVRNPIYDSAGDAPPSWHSGKPVVPPKPLNMANFQHVAEKLSKPRDPLSPGGGSSGAGLVRPDHLPVSTTTSKRPRAPLATPEKGVFSSPVDALKHVFGAEPHDGHSKGMRQRGHKGHAPDESHSDDHSDPIYAQVNKRPGYDKVVNEFSERHGTGRGNASSDSDSKGSVEAERDHPKKKRGSFRKKKKDLASPGQYLDDNVPLAQPHQGDRLYDTVGVLSPDEDGVDPKTRNRQLREEEKNRKREEKRQLAANKKRDKAQRLQQRQKQRQQSKKKKTPKKAPVFAPYLVQKPKGQALEEQVTESDPIPKFVRRCIEFIDREGISQEGIYRVSGKAADCDALTQKFEEDPNMSIDSMDISCHAVASAVKQFFKNLPDPLIPQELQAELLRNFKGKSTEEFLDAMPEFFNKLSPIRLATLRFLMQHFARVCANSEVNKMAEQNLTVCWWPTLLHPEFKSLEDVANESQLSAFVEQWVRHSEKLFGLPADDPTADTNNMAEAPAEEAPAVVPEDPLYDQVTFNPPAPEAEVM